MLIKILNIFLEDHSSTTDDACRYPTKFLDTLSIGFLSTETGVEIKIFKKINSDKAKPFCDLILPFEAVQQVSAYSGRPLDGKDGIGGTFGYKSQR